MHRLVYVGNALGNTEKHKTQNLSKWSPAMSSSGRWHATRREDDHRHTHQTFDRILYVSVRGHLFFCLNRYRFKAIQRFRDAHDDIVGSISQKDKALQKMIKQTDPKLLQEIANECVQSSGMGIHRQKNRTGQEAGQESSGALNGGPTESPEQLRDTFSQSLKVLQYCPVREKQTPRHEVNKCCVDQ